MTNESSSSRVWIFGGTSIIGWNLVCALPSARPFCNPYKRLAVCRNWTRVKLEDESAVAALFEDGAPDILIHCGGVCNVSKCEANPSWAEAMNISSMVHLLRYLPAKTRLIYVSSDHVFGHQDGLCSESTPASPISYYGETRVSAENMVLGRPNSLVLRTGLAIGPSADGRSGHLDWLRYRHQKNLPISIIRDEYRSVIDASKLAQRIVRFAESATSGLRHIVGDEFLDRPALAQQLCAKLNISPRLKMVSRQDQPYPHIGRIQLATDFS